MFDFMINHISRQSKYYKDYQEKHDQSAYKDLFLNWDKFWPENRPTQADVDLIYKRKDRAPKQAITFADGTTEHLWNTFGAVSYTHLKYYPNIVLSIFPRYKSAR